MGEFTFARNRRFYNGLNKAGSASLSVSMDDPLAPLIEPIVTCIVVKLNGNIVWSGPVWTKSSSTGNREVEVSAVGWFELLNHRVIRSMWSGNLIENSSFDTAVTGWITEFGSINHTPDTYYSSPGSMYMTPDAAGPFTGQVSANYLYLPPVNERQYVPGRTFSLKLRIIRDDDWVSDGGMNVYLTARTDAGATIVNTGTVAQYNTTNLPDDEWLETHVTLVPGSGADSIMIHIESGGTLTMAGAGIAVYIDDVVLEAQMNFTEWMTSDLAQYLLDYTNRQSDTGISVGSSPTTWRRTVKYDPLTKIGPEIERMSQIENGYDFEVDPATREFNIHFPYKGNFRARTPTPSEAILALGPTHYFSMDDTSGSVMEDSVENGTDGDYFNTPTLGANPLNSQGEGTSVQFNGTNEYAGAERVDVNNKSFAVSLLVNADDISDVNPLFHMISAQNPYSGVWMYINGSDTGSVHMTFFPSLSQMFTPIGTIEAGITYHIVFTWDAITRNMRIYVNGELLAEQIASQYFTAINPEVYLASHTHVGMDDYLDGRLDDVALWTGRVLSETEVKYLYGVLMGPPNEEYTRIGYNWGPDNIQSVTENVDASRLTNWFVTQGKSTSTSGGALAYDVPSINYYGAFEDSTTLGQVESTQILAAFSNAEVAVLRRPLVTYDVVLRPKVQDNDPMLQPYEDFDVGDVLTMTVKDGTLDIDHQNIRIFGIEISVDDNGVGSVTSLETGP